MTKRGPLRKQQAQAVRASELRWHVAALALARTPPAFKHVARHCWCHRRCFRNRNSSRPSPPPTICPVLKWPMQRNSSTSTPPPPMTMRARSLGRGLPLASHAAPSLATRASCCFPFPAHLKSASPCRRQRPAEGESFSLRWQQATLPPSLFYLPKAHALTRPLSSARRLSDLAIHQKQEAELRTFRLVARLQCEIYSQRTPALQPAHHLLHRKQPRPVLLRADGLGPVQVQLQTPLPLLTHMSKHLTELVSSTHLRHIRQRMHASQ